MRNLRFFAFASLALALGFSGAAFSQGVQTGTITGEVELADGTVVPGVRVTVESPALQGQRNATTGESGNFSIRNLPPGVYTATFELEGMDTLQATANVQLGQTTPLQVTMQISGAEETIVVQSELPSVLASSQVSTTYTTEEINSLPIGRTPAAIAALAPGLTTNTPNAGQLTISGGFAYDNVFLIDGVDANDNLFGTPNPVFIEDAIADTQVLTSGISAEYGRFSGGVVNVITKSGGNEFSGSLRRNFTNDDWRSQTPLEKENNTELIDSTNTFDAATFGGYFKKDLLWFFLAARDVDSTTQSQLRATGLPRIVSSEEDRQEYKLTLNLVDKYQVQGQFTDREAVGSRPSFSFSATPDTVRVRTDPNELKVARFSGVFTPSLFGEVQYSEKIFTFNNTHDFDDLVDSPFFSIGANGSPFIHYNRPYFDGTDPEDRANEQLAASVSYFTDSASAGSHDIKVGFEDFTSFRTGGNSQSSTDFVFYADPVLDAGGDFVFDANGKLIPTFVPEVNTIQNWIPTRGARIDIDTQSIYVNDRWNLNDHWSFNLGFRYEDVSSLATGGIVTVDTDAFVPRLAATYDLRGDGKYRFDATFSEYAGKYSESQFANNTTVGNPRFVGLVYVGPAGQGLDFAPGFDLNNYVPFAAQDGTQNVFVDGDLHSPIVEEVTLSAGMELNNGGYLKAIFTDRSYGEVVEDFLCASAAGVPCPGVGDTGTTDVVVEGIPVGTFNNNVFANSDVPTREYQALQLIGRYRITDNWSVDGHWTHQLKNEGDFEGEGTNTPGSSSTFGDFPGYFNAPRHFPFGRLNDFQEDKIRIWSVYNLNVGRAGTLSFGGLLNFDSGLTTSLTDTLPRAFSPQQAAVLAGYNSLPGSTQTVFFGERGAQEFDSATTVDLSINYAVPIWRDLELWLKGDIVNVFDDDTQTFGNIDINAVTDGPLDSFGLPTTFTAGPRHLDATTNGHFVAPQEYQITAGIRF